MPGAVPNPFDTAAAASLLTDSMVGSVFLFMFGPLGKLCAPPGEKTRQTFVRLGNNTGLPEESHLCLVICQRHAAHHVAWNLIHSVNSPTG